jgi:methyl-accepting chemotaxis protein
VIRKVRHQLWLKITAYGFAAVLFASTTIGSLGVYRQYQASETDLADELTNDIQAIQSDIAGQTRVVAALSLTIAGIPDVGSLIQANAREEILKRFARNYPAVNDGSNVDSLAFADAAGTTVARVHDPLKFGDNVSGRRRMPAIVVQTGKGTAGIEPGRDMLFLFATMPVFNGDKVAGSMTAGTSLTNDYFLRLKSQLKAEIAVHVVDGDGFKTQNSTFGTKGSLLAADELKAVWRRAPLHRTVAIEAGSYEVGGTVLNDFSGSPIAILEVASDVTPIATARLTALWSMGIGAIVVCLIALAGFFVFARSLAAAISRLTHVVGRLAEGQYETEVPSRERADEIGDMARAVEILKEGGVEKLRLAREAAEARMAAEAERTGNERVREAASREQAFVVAQIGEGLRQLSQGNLDHRLTEAFPGEYRQLQDDFNAALKQLEGAMGSILTSTAGLRSGAGEISQAADDLSRRTEQQAASLEQTAAALDEITATVRKTAEGATQAQKAVKQAKNAAERSDEVVRGAVSAMSGIEIVGRNRPDHRRDRRDRVPNQPARAECRRRGGPRRRGG